MSDRKDVFELICLYEGENPRQAYKFKGSDFESEDRPRDHVENLWVTEDPANGRFLVFRSQVPDDLEAAYDIALGEGLLDQHLLEPNQQLSLYKSFGIPLPPQDTDWTVFPANAEALVCITDKGRAVIARHRHKSPSLSNRLKVDLARKTITLDGKDYDVDSELALRWVNVLAEHSGEWISSSELQKFDVELVGATPHKFKKKLPKAILAMINSEPKKGSRLIFSDATP